MFAHLSTIQSQSFDSVNTYTLEDENILPQELELDLNLNYIINQSDSSVYSYIATRYGITVESSFSKYKICFKVMYFKLHISCLLSKLITILRMWESIDDIRYIYKSISGEYLSKFE